MIAPDLLVPSAKRIQSKDHCQPDGKHRSKPKAEVDQSSRHESLGRQDVLFPIPARVYEREHSEGVDQEYMDNIKEEWDFPKYNQWVFSAYADALKQSKGNQRRTHSHEQKLQGGWILCCIQN